MEKANRACSCTGALRASVSKITVLVAPGVLDASDAVATVGRVARAAKFAEKPEREDMVLFGKNTGLEKNSSSVASRGG
jgi:hypothetical protein